MLWDRLPLTIIFIRSLKKLGNANIDKCIRFNTAMMIRVLLTNSQHSCICIYTPNPQVFGLPRARLPSTKFGFVTHSTDASSGHL